MDPSVPESAVSCSQDLPSFAWLFLACPILIVEGRMHGRVKLTGPNCTTAFDL